MNFFDVMAFLIGGGIAGSLFFFRKGGIYNKDMNTDHLTELPLKQPDSTETPPITTITETTPVPPKTSEKRPTLTQFCKAIALMEGANPANHNEGNCRFYEGGYAKMYGTVRRSKGGFAMFATPELGKLYLRNMIKIIIKKYPNLTLFTFFAGERHNGTVIKGGYSGYAPKEDKNDPVHYSNFVAKQLSVDSTFRVSQLVLT